MAKRYYVPRHVGRVPHKPPVKRYGYRPKVYDLSPADLLAESGEGTTQFERQIDAIAKTMGIFFEAYQYYVPLEQFESTRIDFALFNPKRIAVYADGPQHTLRNLEGEDLLRRMELESMGWAVVAIKWNDFLINPYGEVAKILYA